MAVVCGWQSAEAVRRRKLRLARLSEAVRRDEALRTQRHQLRQTDHWSQIDDRQRRIFQQLCDDVRLERRHQRCLDVQLGSQKPSLSSTELDASSQRFSADKTKTECMDEDLAAELESSSSSELPTTTTTTSIHCVRVNERMTNANTVQPASPPTLSDVVAPLSVTLHLTTTSNSTSGMRQTIVTSAALCVTTTVGCSSTTTTTTAEHLCVVVTSTSTTAARQSCVTASSTAALCASRAPNKLPSPTVHGRVVAFNEYPIENTTTNGVVESSNDDDDNEDALRDSSSAVLASTLNTNPVTFADVEQSLSLISSNTELSPASSGVPLPFNNNEKDGILKVSTGAPGVGVIKENVPPVTALINGIAQSPNHATERVPERVNRPASATPQHQAVKQRVGWSGKCVTATSSGRNSPACVGRVPPPVPTRTSSVLTRGGAVAARSVTGRPTSWQAKTNGHLSGKEPSRATPPPSPRFASMPRKSTISNSLSHLSAFRRDKASPATATGKVVKDVTETEII